MNPKDMERRIFLKTAGGIGVGLIFASLIQVNRAIAETCDKATPKNPMVGMLGYVPKSATKNQSCSNCIQFQGKPKDLTAKCPIFSGCEVASTGWCKSWSKKA